MTTLHLYLDESGSFESGDRSAIGGLASEAAITTAQAQDSWQAILGHPLGDEFHATDHSSEVVSRLIVRAIDDWRARDWQPVCFEHVTQRQVVDNATTYVNVFAEGVAAYARRQSFTRTGRFGLRLTAATRVAPKDGKKEFMTRDLYATRLEERLALEKLRAPRAPGVAEWGFGLGFGDAKREPQLALADLWCNAWFRHTRLSPQAQAAIQAVLEQGLFQVLRADDAGRLKLQAERGEFGLALQELQALLQVYQPAPGWLKAARDGLVRQVAQLAPTTLDAALETPVAQITGAADRRDEFDKTDRAAAIFLEQVLEPIRNAVSPTESERLGWAVARVRTVRLAIENHRGALGAAQAHLEAIAPLVPGLASRFERLPQALEIRIWEGVHGLNAYDFDGVYAAMGQLDDTFGGLLSLMGELGASGSSAVQSDTLGKILGTRLQAALMAARRNPVMLEAARSLSQRAQAEFERANDVERQASYRVLIETDAGDFESAGHWLRLAAGLEATAPLAACAEAALKSDFVALHVVRLWEAAARRNDQVRANTFRQLWHESGLAALPQWQAPTRHPMHQVVWKWGAALGWQGQVDQARVLLDRAIKASEEQATHITIRTIGLGAQCDRLALLSQVNESGAYKRALESLETTLGVLLAPKQPASLRLYFEHWPTRVREAAAARDGDAFRALALEIPY